MESFILNRKKIKNLVLTFLLLFCSNFLFADGNKFSDENSFKNSNKEIIHYYLDSSESLHIHSYKDEISELLILHQNESTNKKSLIITSKDYLYRFLYTDDYLLDHVQKWKVGETSESTFLEKLIMYESKTSFTSNSKYTSRRLETDFVNFKTIECVYNENNLLEQKKESYYPNVKDKDNFYKALEQNNSRVENKILVKYDSMNRIICEEEYVYKYNRNSFLPQKVVKKKNEYKYEKVNLPPNVFFYEDDILRMKTIYSSEKNYTQEVYFSEDSYIQIIFENDKKKKETLFVNQEIANIKNYD